MFENPDTPREQWTNKFDVFCDWGNRWSVETVPPCTDRRPCSRPPESSNHGIASEFYELDSPPFHRKSLAVGSRYWYQCRFGGFKEPGFNYIVQEEMFAEQSNPSSVYFSLTGHLVLLNGTIYDHFYLECTASKDLVDPPHWAPLHMWHPLPRCQLIGTYKQKIWKEQLVEC